MESAGHGVQSRQVRAVLEHQASRARIFYSRAVRALPQSDARRFLPAEIMRVIYFDLLRRIEDVDFDVFTAVVKVPRPSQARLALRMWWTLK